MTYATGKSDQAGVFVSTNPATTYISTTDYVFPTSGGSSISFWVKPSSFNTIWFGQNGSSSTYIYLISSTQINVQADASGVQSFTVPAMSTGTWYHVVVTRSGTTLRVYLDGTESSSGSKTLSFVMTINQFGRYGGGSSGFNPAGNLDEVAIWIGKTLSAGEVTTLYNAGNGLFYSRPKILINT
jgi:hypothetical protein